MKTISTRFGEVTVLDPPADLLQSIRSFLPFGLIRNDPPEHGVDYGLVMECGLEQLMGVRQQPEERPYEPSLQAQGINSLLIARSLAAYLTSGFSGLLLPCAYMATKRRQGLFESGIAYFGYPSLLGRECQD